MNPSEPHTPSQEEIDEANRKAREFLDQMANVPADERKILSSDKFAGPIATTIVPETDIEHTSETTHEDAE